MSWTTRLFCWALIAGVFAAGGLYLAGLLTVGGLHPREVARVLAAVAVLLVLLAVYQRVVVFWRERHGTS